MVGLRKFEATKVNIFQNIASKFQQKHSVFRTTQVARSKQQQQQVNLLYILNIH